MSELTHLDESGRARMVDVGDKPATDRRAVARAVVRVTPQTAALVAAGDAPKGDVLGVARIAGIQAHHRYVMPYSTWLKCMRMVPRA